MYSREMQKNRFGHIETVENNENGMEKTIFYNNKHFAMDYER